jgi:hypothetical protein
MANAMATTPIADHWLQSRRPKIIIRVEQISVHESLPGTDSI